MRLVNLWENTLILESFPVGINFRKTVNSSVEVRITKKRIMFLCQISGHYQHKALALSTYQNFLITNFLISHTKKLFSDLEM